MSFKKLDETIMDKVHDRSCIIIVNANKKEIGMIKNLGRLVGIRDCIFVDSKSGNATIKDILDNEISTDNENIWPDKAMIFNNISQLKINGFLDSLKKMKIARPLSAIVTKNTIDWTLNKLVYNLIQERKALSSGQVFNHSK